MKASKSRFYRFLEDTEKGRALVEQQNEQMQKVARAHGGHYLKSKVAIVFFMEGYRSGVNAILEDQEHGTDERHLNIPTSFSRGFAKGVKDAKSGNVRHGIWCEHEPYNEVVAELRERYPDEFPAEDDGAPPEDGAQGTKAA